MLYLTFDSPNTAVPVTYRRESNIFKDFAVNQLSRNQYNITLAKVIRKSEDSNPGRTLFNL